MHLSDAGGSTFDRAVHCKTAARQIFIDSCQFYTKSGIESDGKTVELHMAKSVLFSSSGAAGTFGVKTRSALGGSFFNEGFHITSCTIDAFERAFDIADMFVLCVDNSWIDAASGGNAFYFIEPTTTSLTEDIKVSNCIIALTLNGTAVQFGPN